MEQSEREMGTFAGKILKHMLKSMSHNSDSSIEVSMYFIETSNVLKWELANYKLKTIFSSCSL
jgi:hypothetical protein